MVENSDKPFHSRDFSQEDTLGRFFRSLTVNRDSVEQVLEYFRSGRLPNPIETFKNRIPDFVKPGVIGIDGTNYFTAGLVREKVPFISIANVYFTAFEGRRHSNAEILREFKSHEDVREELTISANWRFSKFMSFEENLAEFTADIFSPRPELASFLG